MAALWQPGSLLAGLATVWQPVVSSYYCTTTRVVARVLKLLATVGGAVFLRNDNELAQILLYVV